MAAVLITHVTMLSGVPFRELSILSLFLSLPLPAHSYHSNPFSPTQLPPTLCSCLFPAPFFFSSTPCLKLFVSWNSLLVFATLPFWSHRSSKSFFSSFQTHLPFCMSLRPFGLCGKRVQVAHINGAHVNRSNVHTVNCGCCLPDWAHPESTYISRMGGNMLYLNAQALFKPLGLNAWLDVWPWENYLTSLSFTFLICQMGTITTLTP